MDTAKTLKKLVLSNRFTLEEISRITGMSISDMPIAYRSYTGHEMPDTMFIVGHDDDIKKIKSCVLAGEKVILHGPPGCGKSISARKAIRDAGFTLNEINISEHRTKELLEIKLFGGHAAHSGTCFLFEEVDNFYWRSYAAFNAVLDESIAPIVMTANEFDKIPESVKKKCTIIRMRPPTMKDLQLFIDKKFPELSLKASELYSPDFREVLRRILHGVRDDHVPEKKYPAEALAGVIIGEPSKAKRLDAMRHPSDPLSWVLPWVDQSAGRLAPDMGGLVGMLDGMSKVDRWMRRTNQKYVSSMMAALPCFNRRVKLDFPAVLFAAEKKREKAVVEVEDGVTKVIKKKQVLNTNVSTFGEF